MDQVVIQGASSTGLYAAWKLGSRGVPITLCERAPNWNRDSRTLIVTPDLWNFIPDYPQERVLHRIEGFLLIHGNTKLRVPLQEPDIIVDRHDLLFWLRRRVEHLGIPILYRHSVTAVHPSGSVVIHRPDKDPLILEHVRHLVVADGVAGHTSKHLNLSSPSSVLLLQCKVKLNGKDDIHWAPCWFDPNRTRYFFWLVPYGFREGVVGVVTEPGQPIRRILDDFIETHGWEPSGYQSGKAALYSPRLKPMYHRGRITIHRVGDAAGQVKVTTVGGTVTGLWGADITVHRILGRPSTFLWGLQKELLIHWAIRRVLNRFRPGDYEHLLRAMNHRLATILGCITRDSMGRNVGRVFSAQPGLFLRYMGYLF